MVWHKFKWILLVHILSSFRLLLCFIVHASFEKTTLQANATSWISIPTLYPMRSYCEWKTFNCWHLVHDKMSTNFSVVNSNICEFKEKIKTSIGYLHWQNMCYTEFGLTSKHLCHSAKWEPAHSTVCIMCTFCTCASQEYIMATSYQCIA